MQFDPRIKPGTPGAAPKVEPISRDVLVDQETSDWFDALASIGALDMRLRKVGQRLTLLSNDYPGPTKFRIPDFSERKQWTEIKHRLLMKKLQPEKEQKITYNNALRYSLLLYCNLFLCDLDATSTDALADRLKIELINLEGRFNRNHFVFLTWMLYVGGIHVQGVERKWWINQIKSTSGSSATTWRESKAKLQEVIWNESVCEAPFHGLWKNTLTST